MFLRGRSRQAEYFDAPERPAEEIRDDYAGLARVNRFFRHADPFVRTLAQLPRPERWREARVLEVGAGTGGLARELGEWAGRQGWSWEFTCLDTCEVALAANPIPRKVRGDATALPFPDRSFDLVIASQMTHHLEDADVVRHFGEAWRVARQGVLISDLHRGLFLYSLFSLMALPLRLNARLRSDGRLSVRRGFRREEWLQSARAAGIPDPRVTVQFGCRIVLWAGRD